MFYSLNNTDSQYRIPLKMRSYMIIISLLWCEVFAFIFLLAGIILGSIGACNYLRNQNDERIYRPWKTICIVRNFTSNRCDCQWSKDFCKTYPCFNEEFLVNYEIFNKTIITSYIQTKGKINEKNFNLKKNETCYYDGRSNITSVKWNYNDKTYGLILFSIGYGIVVVSLPILVIIFVFLRIQHCRNQRKLISDEIGNSFEILFNNDQYNF